MRRRHRRLVSSSTCLFIVLLVLVQVVSALDHGVATPAERRHPRLRRAEKKRQLELIIGSPDNPRATRVVDPDQLSDSGGGGLLGLFGDPGSSTAIGSSTFTSISASSSSASASSSSSISTSAQTSSSGSSSSDTASSSTDGVSRPAGSTPAPVGINDSSSAAPTPSSSTDGGLLGALLGTSAAEPDFAPSSSSSLSSAVSSLSSSQSAEPSRQVAQAASISSVPSSSDPATSSSTPPSDALPSSSSASPTSTDGGLLGGLLGGTTPSSSAAPAANDVSTSSPAPTSTDGGLLGGLLGGDEPSSTSSASIPSEPSRASSTPDSGSNSADPTSSDSGLLDSSSPSASPSDSPSGSLLVVGSTTFEVFPVPTSECKSEDFKLGLSNSSICSLFSSNFWLLASLCEPVQASFGSNELWSRWRWPVLFASAYSVPASKRYERGYDLVSVSPAITPAPTPTLSPRALRNAHQRRQGQSGDLSGGGNEETSIVPKSQDGQPSPKVKSQDPGPSQGDQSVPSSTGGQGGAPSNDSPAPSPEIPPVASSAGQVPSDQPVPSSDPPAASSDDPATSSHHPEISQSAVSSDAGAPSPSPAPSLASVAPAASSSAVVAGPSVSSLPSLTSSGPDFVPSSSAQAVFSTSDVPSVFIPSSAVPSSDEVIPDEVIPSSAVPSVVPSSSLDPGPPISSFVPQSSLQPSNPIPSPSPAPVSSPEPSPSAAVISVSAGTSDQLPFFTFSESPVTSSGTPPTSSQAPSQSPGPEPQFSFSQFQDPNPFTSSNTFVVPSSEGQLASIAYTTSSGSLADISTSAGVSDGPGGNGASSDFGQPTAPPLPSSTGGLDDTGTSQDPIVTSSSGGLLSQIISGILGDGPSTSSTGPLDQPSSSVGDDQPSRSVNPGDDGITSSTSSLPTSSGGQVDDTSTRVIASNDDPVSSTSFAVGPSQSASASGSVSTSSGRGELESVSVPIASGSGVIQLPPSSTSDSWAPSSSASFDDGYTPSQTWLIVAGTSTSSSQAPPPSTSIAPSKTDQGSSTALPVTATIPSSIPTLIVPANSVVNQDNVGTGQDNDPVKDDVLISILLSQDEYPWLFVVQSSDATSQLFNTFPVLISTPLNISSSDVKTYGLMVYQPASWDGREASLLTQYLAYIPSEDFDTLDAYIKNRNSALFQQEGIPGQLAAQINTAYPLAATISGPGGNKTNSSGGSGDSGKTRKIIIGVCVGIGGILWIGLVYWIYKRVKRSNEKTVHRRLSEHMSMFGDFRRSEYGAMGATGAAAHRASQAPSVSPSEIDGRPSSFYASPLENDRSMRQAQGGDPFADGPVTGVSGYSAYTGATGMTPAPGDSPTNYGPSVFGTSWFAQPPGRSEIPPVPSMPGRGSPPAMRQSQNPFEDIVTRSYLHTSGSLDGLSGRRTPGVSKGMISQPVLQANSLEWEEHEGRGFAA